MRIEIKTSKQAIGVIEMKAGSIDPDMMRKLLDGFPTIHKPALRLYVGRVKGNEERIGAILESMPKIVLLPMAESLDMGILAIAAARHPEDAIDIINARTRRKGEIREFAGAIAQALAGSPRPRTDIDEAVMRIATTYPQTAADMAFYHPELIPQILEKVPSSAMGIAESFPAKNKGADNDIDLE